MNRVYKIVVVLLVFGLAIVFGSAGLGQQSNASAFGGYELYIINNPTDVSLYRYSIDGVNFYDIPGSLSNFVATYYSGITHTEPLQLFIGNSSSPVITPHTITISKDTQAEIYLQNTFASTVAQDAFNRDVVIATASAIILSNEANLEVNKAFITTDGARAITQASSGTLTINGTEQETVIHSTNIARPTYGGTIFVDNITSASPAYIQNGGSVLNSCDMPYSSVLLNYSGRDIYINAGNVVSTPTDNPFDEYGMGITGAILNVSDGVINISQLEGRQTTIATANASNYYVGTINLSGVAADKTTLNITGGNILNLNTNIYFVAKCYTIYAVNPNNISVSNAYLSNTCGYVINNDDKGDVYITDTEIINSYTSAILMPKGYLDIYNSTINASSSTAPAIRINEGTVDVEDCQISNSIGGVIYVKTGDVSVRSSELIAGSLTESTIKADNGSVDINNSQISNSGTSVSINKDFLTIKDSQISSTDTNMPAIRATDAFSIEIEGSTIESTFNNGAMQIKSKAFFIETTQIVGSSVLVYFEALESAIIFDNFIIVGSVNTHIKIVSDSKSIDTAANDFDIVAVNNVSEDEFFRAWYKNSVHYSYNNTISANGLPQNSILSVVFEQVYSFIQDPNMQNGQLISHTPIKNFRGLEVTLEFLPATAYYLYEAYYFDELNEKVSLYLHSGTNYTNKYVNAIMTEGDQTVYATFRPIPITVNLNNITTIYGNTNIRFNAVINAYSGVTYYYSWYRDGAVINGETKNYLQLTDVDDSGNYSVRVASNLAGSNTAEAFATATINPKPLPIVWDEVKVFQYSGTDQYPLAYAYDLEGNPLVLTYYGISHLVGRHTISVQTNQTNFVLTNNSTEYDITPLSTTLVWSNLSFVYDGASHCPEAYAEDVAGNPLNITVSGSQSNARETPYLAHAATTDGSYVFVNADIEFTISPAETTVHWSFQYTDSVYNLFFYNGFDQLMRIYAYYYTIYDYRVELDVFVKGETNNETVFMKPDTYEVTADFMYPTPNYTLKSETTQLKMFKARPYITVPQNNLEYVYNGQEFSITANITYADNIIYMLNGRQVENSFTQPGVYSLTLKSLQDDLHDRAAEVNVTLTILATSLNLNDDEGNLVSSIYNSKGINPNAVVACDFNNKITPEINKKYTDFWGRTVLTVINLSVLDQNEDNIELEGTSKVRIKINEDILSNSVLKLRSLNNGKAVEFAYTVDEEGYIEFETDTLGEFVLIGTSGFNSIIGVAAIVVISLAIISSLIIFLVRRKKSVY